MSVRLGKYGAYNPSHKGMSKVKAYVEEYVKETSHVPFLKPLLMVIHFRMPLARSSKLVEPPAREFLPHAIRPDGDNLEKLVNDCFKGLVWKDDSQLFCVLRYKSWTKYPEGETRVFIQSFDKDIINAFDIKGAILESEEFINGKT
jgi:Holliday junction resolvase RusA-like endonuclease